MPVRQAVSRSSRRHIYPVPAGDLKPPTGSETAGRGGVPEQMVTVDGRTRVSETTDQGLPPLVRCLQKVTTASAPKVKLLDPPLLRAGGFWLNGLLEVKA